jgi:hypothetical protein
MSSRNMLSHNRAFTLISLGTLIALCVVFVGQRDESAADSLPIPPHWEILSNSFKPFHVFDAMAFEWEYFQIHSPEFNGVVGYVLQNPRQRKGLFSWFIPTGMGVAFSGKFEGSAAFSHYGNIPFRDLTWNSEGKGFSGYTETSKPKETLQASMELQEDKFAILQGEGFGYRWNLRLVPDTTVPAFAVATDTHMIPRVGGQNWTVSAKWPKASATGEVTHLSTGETTSVNGKAYRENSWGRYAMPFDGWDFLVFNETDPDGVAFVLQTYHHSKQLDFLDVSFVDQGVRKAIKVDTSENQLNWKHSSWVWDPRSHQCVPLDWELSAVNQDYVFDAKGSMPLEAQAPFLSNETLGTRIFFIQEQYPLIQGTIKSKSTGAILVSFEGQGGGEFAVRRAARKNGNCEKFGGRFQSKISKE